MGRGMQRGGKSEEEWGERRREEGRERERISSYG